MPGMEVSTKWLPPVPPGEQPDDPAPISSRQEKIVQRIVNRSFKPLRDGERAYVQGRWVRGVHSRHEPEVYPAVAGRLLAAYGLEIAVHLVTEVSEEGDRTESILRGDVITPVSIDGEPVNLPDYDRNDPRTFPACLSFVGSGNPYPVAQRVYPPPADPKPF